MVSELVFNPQSLLRKRQKDDDILKKAMAALLNFLKMLQKLEAEEIHIRTNKLIAHDSIMLGYSLQDWIKEYTNSQAERLLIIKLLVKRKTKVPAWVGLKSEEQLNNDFCFDDTTWALAYFFDYVLFSLFTADTWDNHLFECDYLDLTVGSDDYDDITKLAIIRHACRGSHLSLHKRIYNPHSKHVYYLAHTGPRDTEMDLKDDEAERLLNKAVRVPSKKQLIGYSKRTKKLYEFKPESPLPPSGAPLTGNQNQYHGYWITPKELHDDVGGSIFEEVVEALEERTIVDTDTADEIRKAV